MKYLAIIVLALLSAACRAQAPAAAVAPASADSAAASPRTDLADSGRVLVLEPQARPELPGEQAKARAALIEIEQKFSDHVGDAVRARGTEPVVVVDTGTKYTDEQKLVVHAIKHATTRVIVLHLVNAQDADGESHIDMQAECVRLVFTRRDSDTRPGIHVANVETHVFRLWSDKSGDSPRSFQEMAQDLVKVLDLGHWF